MDVDPLAQGLQCTAAQGSVETGMVVAQRMEESCRRRREGWRLEKESEGEEDTV